MQLLKYKYFTLIFSIIIITTGCNKNNDNNEPDIHDDFGFIYMDSLNYYVYTDDNEIIKLKFKETEDIPEIKFNDRVHVYYAISEYATSNEESKQYSFVGEIYKYDKINYIYDIEEITNEVSDTLGNNRITIINHKLTTRYLNLEYDYELADKEGYQKIGLYFNIDETKSRKVPVFELRNYVSIKSDRMDYNSKVTTFDIFNTIATNVDLAKLGNKVKFILKSNVGNNSEQELIFEYIHVD